jgi:replicative DNA helicase
MSREQLIRRVESQLSGLNGRNIENKKVYADQVEKLDNARKRIRKMSLLIDDSAAISVPKMKLKAKRVKNKYGLDFIVVDYLQLASGTQKGNREQEISEISRNLKVLAKELEVPVYALSQLSRAVESRSDKRPMLSDLRESGSIEQDADIVAFLYREKYYKKELQDDICELIIAKHRNGNLETINFLFDGATTSFKETELSLQPHKEQVISPFGKGNWTKVRDLTDEHIEDTPF